MSKRNKKLMTRADDNKRNESDLTMRNICLEVRGEGEDQRVHMSVSSEEPVLEWVNFNDQWMRAWQILDHSEGSIDMSRAKDGLVILDRHFGDQVGLMAAEVKDRKLGGTIEFCSGKRAQELEADAKKKLRRNTSAGFQVDVSSYRLEGEKDGFPVVRAMSWAPHEASFEPVPADITVGVGRSAKEVKVKPVEKSTQKEVRKMDPKLIAEMYELAARHQIDAGLVTRAIADKKGIDEIRKMVEAKQTELIESLRTTITESKTKKPDEHRDANEVQPIGGSNDEQEKIMRKYSVMNVIRSIAGGKVDIGFEREVSDECAKMRGKSANGIIIPHAALGQRDFTKSGTSSSSVATNLLAGEFIDLLRTKTALAPLGVHFMSGLVGDVAIPKMTGGATGYWVAEGEDITESTPTLGQVTGTPHTAGALVDISRRLMIQSTPDAEMMVRNEIVQRVGRTVQIAVFQGTGANGQPLAITGASGINNPSVTQGTPTYAELLGFPGSIMGDNAESDGQKWVMTAEVWQKLAGTFIDSNSNAERVLDYNSKTVLGYPYEVTEDVGANSLFFGAWNTVNVGIWGNGIDINADTATLSASGGLRLVALQDVDVMVRLGEALAYNTAVTADA